MKIIETNIRPSGRTTQKHFQFELHGCTLGQPVSSHLLESLANLFQMKQSGNKMFKIFIIKRSTDFNAFYTKFQRNLIVVAITKTENNNFPIP